MTSNDYFRILGKLCDDGKISEDTFNQMMDHSEDFCDEYEEYDSRFPAGYCEIEYDDMDTPEAAMGARFDDMNYLRYFER